MGTGPFKCLSFKAEELIELEAYKDYWNGASPLDTVSLYVISDDSTRAVALQSGQIDMGQRIAAADIATLKNDSDYAVYEASGTRIMVLVLNHTNEFLSDVNVRKALACCINYDAMVAITGGDSTGEGSVGQLFGQYFSERVTDITEGSLSVNYHPNGKLGGDLDLLGMVKANRIQIVVCQTAPMVSFIPEMAVFDLPMVFAEYDGDRIDAVLNGHNAFTERLNEACEKQGFHLLGFLQNGTYRLTTSNRDL